MEDNSLELRRQTFHMGLGMLFVLLISLGFDWRFFLALIIVGAILSYVSARRKIPVIAWFLEKFERKNSWPGKGALFFAIGTFLALVLFPRDIALASILILTFGDSLAHLFGRFFGKVKHPLNTYKMIEGTIIGFLAGGIAAAVFVPWQQAMAASAVAMFVEGIDLRFRRNAVDDNIVVPLVAGVVIWLFRSFINVPV
ncbi:MAG: diacylglycerol/polyprenol kinase family protein [Candidatus Woesearchaeota archaeon]